MMRSWNSCELSSFKTCKTIISCLPKCTFAVHAVLLPPVPSLRPQPSASAPHPPLGVVLTCRIQTCCSGGTRLHKVTQVTSLVTASFSTIPECNLLQMKSRGCRIFTWKPLAPPTPHIHTRLCRSGSRAVFRFNLTL